MTVAPWRQKNVQRAQCGHFEDNIARRRRARRTRAGLPYLREKALKSMNMKTEAQL